jgi:hypothetical protein
MKILISSGEWIRFSVLYLLYFQQIISRFESPWDYHFGNRLPKPEKIRLGLKSPKSDLGPFFLRDRFPRARGMRIKHSYYVERARALTLTLVTISG